MIFILFEFSMRHVKKSDCVALQEGAWVGVSLAGRWGAGQGSSPLPPPGPPTSPHLRTTAKVTQFLYYWYTVCILQDSLCRFHTLNHSRTEDAEMFTKFIWISMFAMELLFSNKWLIGYKEAFYKKYFILYYFLIY